MSLAKYPTAEQFGRLLEGPAETPVVMVNLLTFNETAGPPDEGVSGEEAYDLYAREMIKIVESHGGRILWMGDVDSIVIGEPADEVHAIALVEYPSRAAFAEIVQDPRVQEIGLHREAGLQGQWLIAATERSI